MTDSGTVNEAGPLLKNRYRLGRVLGRGGMCIVYQAWDTRLQRDVAIKRLEPPLNQDARTRARFDREGRALARLSHPNLVTLIDRGSTESDEYLVFEYVEGRSLKEIIKEKPLDLATFGNIAGQVVEGLAAAHLAGIVHRDVKPQNILVDRQGHAKVTDFGIAIGPDWTRVTRAGSIIGSARYMSPEQIRSKPVDQRSDIYSLGVVMYEMLAGKPPFDGANMPEIARQHLTTPPVPLSRWRSDIPSGLEKVIMRCLEKDPSDRFLSMDELLGALVGLGLYTPRYSLTPTTAGGRRRDSERDRSRRSSRELTDSGAWRASDSGEIPAWQRERLRALARKRRRLRNLKWGAGIAAVIVAVVLALVFTLGNGGAPAVVGLTLDQARQLAAQAGMQVEVTSQVPSFDKPAGTVLEQDPAPEMSSNDDVLRLTVTREPTPVKVLQISDYDPEGDQTENPTKLKNLVDGKESTSWTTELYRSTAFGNLKTGVGVEFALEDPATIIEVIAGVEGWRGELLDLTSGTPATVVELDGTSTQLITLREPMSKGRLWFTELTQITDGRWGVELSEIRFYK